MAVGAGSGMTVNANDVTLTTGVRGDINVATPTDWQILAQAVGNNELANMAANSIKANPTGVSAIAQDVAVSADSVLARVGGNLVSHPWSTLAGVRLTYAAGVMDVDLAASYAWTNDHTWSGTLDWSADITGVFGARCTSAMDLECQSGDVRVTAGINIDLTAANVRLRPISGAGAFLTLDGGSASTPSVLANDGMFWVEDPGAAPTKPRFTDDSNVDHSILPQQLVRQDFTTSGTSNNVALNANTTYLRIDTGGSAWTITGFSGGYDGRILHITTNSNVTGTLSHVSAGSSAANQISCGGSVNATGNRLGATLIYDGDDSLWRVVGVNIL
jgi:hypothetical protein